MSSELPCYSELVIDLNIRIGKERDIVTMEQVSCSGRVFSLQGEGFRQVRQHTLSGWRM